MWNTPTICKLNKNCVPFKTKNEESKNKLSGSQTRKVATAEEIHGMNAIAWLSVNQQGK